MFLLQLTAQQDRFLLFNLPLGLPTLPGPVFGRPDDDDDAASVSSQSSVSSAASEVAGPSRDVRTKKRLPAKQVIITKPAAFVEIWSRLIYIWPLLEA
jgi:hypothetical protein